MGWHVDDVLYEPEAQIEVVYTIENTSDCCTMWRTGTSIPMNDDNRHRLRDDNNADADRDNGKREMRHIGRDGSSGDARRHDVRSIQTTPNSVLILGAGGAEHKVTPLTSGRRTILKMAYVRLGSGLIEDMAGHVSHHHHHHHRHHHHHHHHHHRRHGGDGKRRGEMRDVKRRGRKR
jgi:hypothetical protein